MENIPFVQNQNPDRPPSRARRRFVVAAVLVILAGLSGAAVWNANRIAQKAVADVSKPPEPLNASDPVPVAEHVPMPKTVYGVYITASTASGLQRFESLVKSVKGKGVNTVVLDLKADDGSLAFAPRSGDLKPEAVQAPLIKDLDSVVSFVHGQGMYLVARVPVFEDPAFVKHHPEIGLKKSGGGLWSDRKGILWADPAAQIVWKYTADIAKEAYTRGFDEIQFDYIRFATDGTLSSIVFPVYDKTKETYRQTMERFFAYLDHELRSQGVITSVDLFGLTTWHTSDMGIGQWLADALAHFDFVSPMVYPSHYPAGTLKYSNPAAHPYEIVADSIKKGQEVVQSLRDSGSKTGELRPWLQAFNLGATYTPDMVMAQVNASRENGANGFLFWNAGNKYDSLPRFTGNK